MSDSNAGGASTQDSSGTTEKQTEQDKVAYDTYRRVLSEAKKLKEQVKLYEEEKNKGNEDRLKEQQQYKTLAETYKTQLEQKSKLLEEQESSIVNGMKYQEFEKHLNGKLKSKDYATFIEFEKIAIDPETKRIDEESVKSVVSKFVKEHSSLVDFGGGAKLPNQAARAGSVGGKDINSMTSKELEAYIKEQHKAGLIK